MTARSALLALLRAYKRWLSPLLPAACRFYPTCSEYAHDAVTIHGIGRGGLLALRRMLRCHPFNRGGFDPVPPPGPRWADPGRPWAG
jgi:putative membrane protein insertion efficiency factor